MRCTSPALCRQAVFACLNEPANPVICTCRTRPALPFALPGIACPERRLLNPNDIVFQRIVPARLAEEATH